MSKVDVTKQIADKKFELDITSSNITKLNEQIKFTNDKLMQPGISGSYYTEYTAQVKALNTQLGFYNNQLTRLKSEIAKLEAV
jgi:peptidoglycan hydrolase CwlO-like protein